MLFHHVRKNKKFRGDLEEFKQRKQQNRGLSHQGKILVGRENVLSTLLCILRKMKNSWWHREKEMFEGQAIKMLYIRTERLLSYPLI